jgi:cytochrome b involved in lipid metabolism
LLTILERLQHVTEVSLPKINPNPHSTTHVDPVVWAKTVAPFATPFRDDVPGPSGTASPIFHLLDIFLGRPAYDSFLGTEMTNIRRWYPEHWRHFLEAVAQVSVRDFVTGSNDPRLQGIYQTVVEHYTGDKGFFGVHQLKVYGYLEMAFKMGRSVTIGGFRGLFKDREWNRVDAELNRTRHERRPVATAPTLLAMPSEDQPLAASVDIGHVLEQEAQAIWDLLRAESEGGRGAYFYVCGRTDVAVAVTRAVRSILERFSNGRDDARRTDRAAHRFFHLVADGRFQKDVFTTYSGPYAAETRRYDASEVVMHNNDAHGRWLVVDGKVYDVDEFRFLHPGGDKIVAAYCGIDATDAYQRVQHHVNPEVAALLTMHEIGAIRRLDFGARWAVVTGPAGLTYVSLDEVFRLWVRYLYLIVEMENALEIDQSVLVRSTTAGEDPNELTPYKVQLAAGIHERFVSLYLDGLTGGDLHELWAITTGLCNRDAHVLTMQQLIAEAKASPDATVARTAVDHLQRLGERWSHAAAGDTGMVVSVAQIEALSALLGVQDKWLLSRMKRTLRAGVQVFEEYTADTAERGGERLMATLEHVPRLVQQYYRALAHGVRAILADAATTGMPEPTDAHESSASRCRCGVCGAALEAGRDCPACGAPPNEATAGRRRFVGHGL